MAQPSKKMADSEPAPTTEPLETLSAAPARVERQPVPSRVVQQLAVDLNHLSPAFREELGVRRPDAVQEVTKMLCELIRSGYYDNLREEWH